MNDKERRLIEMYMKNRVIAYEAARDAAVKEKYGTKVLKRDPREVSQDHWLATLALPEDRWKALCWPFSV